MIQFVVFSRRRPLQLHGYLASLYAHCAASFRVSALVKIDPDYAEAYAQVAAEFPQAAIVPEGDFAGQLALLVDTDAEYTCFGCDDVVWAAHVEPEAIASVMDAKPELLGISLRLGRNITRDMFGRPLRQPEVTDLTWDMMHYQSVGDWAYPWEVLGTVYRTEYVKQMVGILNARSPSQLEERGSRHWQRFAAKHHMAMYPTSRLVVPTVNLVQEEFPNGIVGEQSLSSVFLLDCWNHGLRLDTARYKGVAPESWRIGDFYLRRIV